MPITFLSQDQIKFFSDHRPALENGDYTVTVAQSIATKNGDDGKSPPQAITQNNFTTTHKFSVLGPRFSLDPSEIRAVFPPEGSLGEHSNVLPHIILNRATLPWERSAFPNANGTDDTQDPPWLALLVFDEGEEPTPQVVTLSTLGFPGDWDKQNNKLINGSLFYMGLKPEYGQHADDQVALITVSATLLNAIVPNRVELDWLAHARQATDANGQGIDEPFAVLFANRLPTPNGHTTVHLVSLEGLYTGGDFTYKGTTTGNISLVSLKSWRFACVSPQHDLKNLLLHLDAQPFRLPTLGAQSEPYLKQGLAPFAHAMRQGNRSVSWYRGPLLPGGNPSAQVTLPVPNADSLARYYSEPGMFDVTYAAAWELGRLLALQNKRVSVDLFNWKRANAQRQKDAENLLDHLPLMGQPPDPLNMPDSVTTWYQQLSLLNGIPFNYLVPDEKLLPAESIRFFQVDPLWMECLLDGAFAVGRVLEEDAQLKNDGKVPAPAHQNLSGFLLRSSVVAGYPDLLVDGYVSANSTTPLTCLRMERLSSNVLLCLFAGIIARVDIHQKPEVLHFGFDPADPQHPGGDYYKVQRTSDGHETALWVSIDWADKDKRRVDIQKLQKDIQTKLGLSDSNWNVAQFAMQMIEGVEKVQFWIYS